MAKILAAIALLLSLSSPAFAGKREPLISLREDSSGHGMRTRDLMLREDGTVVLETYDFYKSGADEWHVITVIRKVPRRDVKPLVHRAASLVESLPKLIDEERAIPLDPESKAIRVRLNGAEVFSGWAAYQDAPPSAQSDAFKDVWQTIEASLVPSGAQQFIQPEAASRLRLILALGPAMTLQRRTICALSDEAGERELARSWLEEHRPSLTFVSGNQGCGCCIDMWDIEGDESVLSTIPPSLLAESPWSSGLPSGA